jgi:hypothetical protein
MDDTDSFKFMQGFIKKQVAEHTGGTGRDSGTGKNIF